MRKNVNYYDREIKILLKERYPNDPAIQHITLKEIRKAIDVYFENIEKKTLMGFLVKLGTWSSLYMTKIIPFTQDRKKRHQQE